MTYYNEFDPNAAEWLRELMKAGLIEPGRVDERSIAHVQADDLVGVRRAHFFAGIGGWDYALALAGWPADRPVWTGSCPCQPFSSAGKRQGEADERHLWPEFLRLLRERRPATVFGEQVASNDGREWLARVRADLEAVGYAVGTADLCSAGVGSPHRRQRLYWVAHAPGVRRGEREHGGGVDGPAGAAPGRERVAVPDGLGGVRPARGVADPPGPRRQGGQIPGTDRGDADDRGPEEGGRPAGGVESERGGPARRLADADGGEPGHRGLQPGEGRATGRTGDAGFWSASDLLPCRDGKSRRVEPGTFPLAHGIPGHLDGVWAESRVGSPPQGKFPGRVALLRGYGNAITPDVAAVFIRAFLEAGY